MFIDNVAGAESLAKKALKIAGQCKANLKLCNIVTSQVKEKLLAHHYDFVLLDEEGFDIRDLAKQLKVAELTHSEFIPTIDCFEISNFNPATIREMVIRHNIWLIIMDEPQLNHIKNFDSGNYALKVINNINCPVLLMPQDIELSYLNKIAYVTDLRYCDLGVIRFLKVFNAMVFVTHVSAPGLPDMEERYAQEILAEEVSVKANYWKLFLRNIKSRNIKEDVNKILDTLEIRMLAFVNKKHQTFERLFDNYPDRAQIYHNLPTLIFPYLNWFNQSSFYSN